MKHRFRFLGARIKSSDAMEVWKISNDEFFQLTKILRLKIGDEVEAFDARGNSTSGKIVSLSAKEALLEGLPLKKQEIPTSPIIVGLGVLKPGFMDELLPYLVELGADEIHIFLQRGVQKKRIGEKSKVRWDKICLAAVKQCKRAFLPKIQQWASLDDFLKESSFDGRNKLYLNLEAEIALAADEGNVEKGTCLLVGGEIGFSELEIDLMEEHGFKGRKLGAFVLRAITASIAATAIVAAKTRGSH